MKLVKAKPIMSKKYNHIQIKSPVDKLELENQFIIRFPENLANIVHEAIAAENIHEKLSIQLDTDQRYGEVRLNDQLLHAKLVDLPTVIESYKTADNTNLYKTADISQLLVCNRERPKDNEKAPAKLSDTDTEDEPNEVSELERELAKQLERELEKELGWDTDPVEKLPEVQPEKSPQKNQPAVNQTPKKPGRQSKSKNSKDNKSPLIEDPRDFLKVDEKYLWPHGLTPPCRNLRRRRLNNALKDKATDPPEPDILREVKYLLRMDSEAVRVTYKVVNESGMTPTELSEYEGSDDTDDESKDEVVQ